MGIIWNIQNKLKSYRVIIFLSVILAYFAFSALNGERSIIRYFYLQKEIASRKVIAAQYEQQKRTLEEKVKHLSNSSLDLDLLEERARIVLNLAADDEFVLLDEDK